MNTKLVSQCSAKKEDTRSDTYSIGQEQSFLANAVDVKA